MIRCSTLTLMTVALGLAISPPAFAQEKQQVSFNTPAENSRYTEKTENLELGDVPDHVLRVFEIRRSYPGVLPSLTV